MPTAQAEALAYHYANLLDDRLATKDDIKLLASNVGKDNTQLANKIEQLASDGKNDIELAASGLWIKMRVGQFGMACLIIGALGFLS